ncbi:MAG TPA: penicillin-binding transpeptidase domain-containing protein [Solirubrobacteraceae bacterium]|nr:penicillin-binding transpeptidase domain-containing protein [Solirubrobacteraceae bacterium]
MIQPTSSEERRAPLTPQLARRVALLGTFALAMFAIVFFRLWFLQVLSGQKYLAQAKVNRVRDVAIPAPRGDILDRSGNLLVSSKRALAVQINPAELPVPLQYNSTAQEASLVAHPPQKDVGVYRRLAHVLGVSNRPRRCPVPGFGTQNLSQIACLVTRGFVQLSYANVTVATDVPNDVLFYLEERQSHFPGVSVQNVWLRTYPLHTLAAQLFGTIGPLSPSELADPRFKGLSPSSIVGQSGLEWYYNRYLQGHNGAEQVQVNALGQSAGTVGSPIQPVPGDNLRLSLDVNLQRAGEEALAQEVNSIPYPDGGAFVALNPVNGEVYAMGSNPSFDPNIFTKPVPTSVYQQLNSPASDYPLLNRAIQTAGPTGSTFKAITATAALQSGAWSVGSVFDDTGQFCFPPGTNQCRHNAGNAVDGVLNLTEAIKVSSDDFFYNLGVLTNSDAPNGGALQHWARLYGIGSPTGIDLGGEVAGTLPDAAWRAHRNRLEYQCDNALGPFKYTNGQTTSSVKHPGWHRTAKHPPGGCGIADGTNRPWSVGDNENLAVGQGDVQVTPLQLAVAYAAVANNGYIVKPHLGFDIEQPDGTLIQRIDPPPKRHLNINPLYLETIRQGLREAASQPGGTSYPIMGNFPEQVYGKTGTAQYIGQPDYSWYVCFVPASATSKPILVAVTVPRAGFGAQAAAPVARQILSQWFFGKPGTFLGTGAGGAL